CLHQRPKTLNTFFRDFGRKRLALHFAVCRARYPIDEENLARHFVGCEVLRRESFDRRRVGLRTLGTHDERSDDRDVAAHANFRARNFGYPGATCECGLNLLRRDAITTGIHQFVRSAEMRDVAVIIDGAKVAADEPFATENLRFLFWPPPVAEPQPRVGEMQRYTPFGSWAQRA